MLMQTMARLALKVWRPSLRLALALCLGAAGGIAPAPRAARADVWPNQVFLPMTARNYLPGYEAPFGIAMFGNVNDAAGLAAMKTAGAKWVMTDLRWETVEPVEGGGYNWAGLDASLVNATAAGMRIFLLVDRNPGWAADTSRGPLKAGKQAAFLAFVQAAAQRYNGDNGFPRIDYWSFYGEPDNQSAWGNSAAEYADLLAATAPVVHAANPSAQVMIGALAYDLFTDDEIHGAGNFVRAFLGNVLQRLNSTGQLAATLDAFAFHYYRISVQRWPSIKEKTAELVGILNQYGAGSLPLIVPEVSMWSTWPDGDRPHAQAQELVKMYTQGLAANLEQLHWFQVFDVPDDPNTTADDTSRTQGLFVEQDLNQPREAYTAYTVLARELFNWQYASALNVAGAEGYVFTSFRGSKTVVWGTSTSGPTAVNFAQTCRQVVGLLGTSARVTDGGAGDLGPAGDGQIRLQVDGSEPIYVGPCS